MTRVRAGQSIRIGRALAGVAALGIFYAFAIRLWNPLYDEVSGEAATNSTSAGLEITDAIFSNYLLLFLLVAAMGVTAFAVFQRRGI